MFEKLAFLKHDFIGNPLYDWAAALTMALLIVLAVLGLKWLLKSKVGRAMGHVENKFARIVYKVLAATRFTLVLLFAISFSFHYLQFPQRVENLVRGVTVFSAFIQLGLWLTAALYAAVESTQKSSRYQASPGAMTNVAAFRFLGAMVVWTLLLLFTLDNLGVNISALVAGLGVGGIAVGLAVQNILGDLFASISIVVDKPFVLGDFIVVETLSGTVESIGLKTTRIRSLSGEQIVFSNNKLLGLEIRNYKRMRERRILFQFGVTYQTPPEQLEQLPTMVKNIIENIEVLRFDRAHFCNFGDSAYEFEVVYWVKKADYIAYMDAHQQINLAMVRLFAKEGIDFAYPTRTLFIEGQEPPSKDTPPPNPA
ncbi:mechanosensitive ion channel family protein [Gallaecimonas mangrovi]|uniref:mechanosensitive ion channel family protein n=1 Tax=Gallaecimonas mangrovi TaxID=2291597 RepID=UPI000E206050|nr:mechanosensitive ion channel family protein [Gallaecimonas mangrovi]